MAFCSTHGSAGKASVRPPPSSERDSNGSPSPKRNSFGAGWLIPDCDTPNSHCFVDVH